MTPNRGNRKTNLFSQIFFSCPKELHLLVLLVNIPYAHICPTFHQELGNIRKSKKNIHYMSPDNRILEYLNELKALPRALQSGSKSIYDHVCIKGASS